MDLDHVTLCATNFASNFIYQKMPVADLVEVTLQGIAAVKAEHSDMPDRTVLEEKLIGVLHRTPKFGSVLQDVKVEPIEVWEVSNVQGLGKPTAVEIYILLVFKGESASGGIASMAEDPEMLEEEAEEEEIASRCTQCGVFE